MSQVTEEQNDAFLAFLKSKGNVGALMSAHNWQTSSLGHPSTWPRALRSMVKLMLDARFPMFVAWGPDLAFLYNQPYTEFLAGKHPDAMGQPFEKVWTERWPEIHARASKAMLGESCYFEDLPILLQRHGRQEKLYFTLSYSPVYDDDDQVGGMYCLITETTARVVADKRHAFHLQVTDSLRALAEPAAIMQAASRLTGLYLNVGRVGYAEIDEDKKSVSVERDWTSGRLGSLAGETRPLESFGPAIIDVLRSGQTLRIEDIATDSRSASYTDGYASIGARSMTVVPLLEGKRLTAAFYLHEALPRYWTDEEVILVEDVARHTWETVKRARVEETLRDETRMLELLNKTGQTLASTLDLQTLLQAITDAGTELSGAQFGAFFYNGTDQEGDATLLYTLSGAPIEAFEQVGHPRATPLFGPTFSGNPPVRSDDVTQDPRYGKMSPHHGMPSGHLPVRSYLAVPVISRSGEVLGGLFFGHGEAGVFTERTEKIICSVAAQAAVAIDNARLYELAQQSAREREALLDSERSARAEAERLNRMKDEFLAMLAHELRNPLAPISSSAEVLKLLFANEPRVRQTSAIISRQVAHMTRLINDLLDVSRVTRGLITLNVRLIEFQSVIAGAVDQARPLIDQKRHHVNLEIPAEPVYVEGDHTRLIQAVANILNNAAKYTPENGIIDVRMQVAQDCLELHIADNGSGMPAELVPSVFDLFTQGARTLARSQGGLGLGLTLVKKLVELHGGHVTAESSGSNRGSKFIISLPVRTGSAGNTAAADSMQEDDPWAVAPACDKGLRIMVIDDNVDAADSLAALLRAQGYPVLTEYSAKKALHRAALEAPDVLLIDIGLPDMDGFELAQHLLALPQTASATLIAVTGYGQSKDRERAKTCGFSNHLVKPVNMIALSKALEALAIPLTASPARQL